MLLILVVDASDSENIHTYSATYYKILHTDTQHRCIETFAVQANHSSAELAISSSFVVIVRRPLLAATN